MRPGFLRTACVAAVLVSSTALPAETNRTDDSPYKYPETELILLRDSTRRVVTTTPEQARKNMLDTQRTLTRGLYAQFFVDRNLTEPQIDALASLIAEQQVLTTSWTSGSFSFKPQETDLELARAVDAKISQFLGPAGFEEYRQYQDTLREQYLLRRLRDSLIAAGHPLTSDQAAALVSAVKRERAALDASPVAEAYTMEYAEELVRRRDEYDRRIQPSFDALLSAEQRAVAERYFAAHQERRHRALESYRRAFVSGSRFAFTYPMD